jgi:hypothetical protein
MLSKEFKNLRIQIFINSFHYKYVVVCVIHFIWKISTLQTFLYIAMLFPGHPGEFNQSGSLTPTFPLYSALHSIKEYSQ